MPTIEPGKSSPDDAKPIALVQRMASRGTVQDPRNADLSARQVLTLGLAGAEPGPLYHRPAEKPHLTVWVLAGGARLQTTLVQTRTGERLVGDSLAYGKGATSGGVVTTFKFHTNDPVKVKLVVTKDGKIAVGTAMIRPIP